MDGSATKLGPIEDSSASQPAGPDGWIVRVGLGILPVFIGAMFVIGGFLFARALMAPGQSISAEALRLVGGAVSWLIGLLALLGWKIGPTGMRLDSKELVFRFRKREERVPYASITSATMTAGVRWHASLLVTRIDGDELRLGTLKKEDVRSLVGRIEALRREAGTRAPSPRPRIVRGEPSPWEGSVLTDGTVVPDMAWIDIAGLGGKQNRMGSQLDLQGTRYAETHEMADLPHGWWMTMEAHESGIGTLTLLLVLISIWTSLVTRVQRQVGAPPGVGIVVALAVAVPLLVWAYVRLREERRGAVAASAIFLPLDARAIDVRARLGPLLAAEGLVAKRDRQREAYWEFRSTDRAKLLFAPAGKEGTRSASSSFMMLGQRGIAQRARHRRLKGLVLEEFDLVPPTGAVPPTPALTVPLALGVQGASTPGSDGVILARVVEGPPDG